MIQETTADLAEMWLLLVELFLQAFQKLPLESVDFLNVAKDSADMLLSEHVCPLTALFDVTLSKTKQSLLLEISKTLGENIYFHIYDSLLTNR